VLKVPKVSGDRRRKGRKKREAKKTFF